MLKSSDVAGRLRLFRYGLIVVVVVTFLVSLTAPYAALSGAGVSITEFLDEAVIYTVVVAIIAVILYFVYASILRRSGE
jgi:hypothetical protein